MQLDPSGRADGRGAYICRKIEHAGATNLRNRIRNALRLEAEVSDEFVAELAGWLQGNARSAD